MGFGFIKVKIYFFNLLIISLKSITVKGANTVDLPIFNQLTEDEVKSYLDNKN
jgi:hypothetical protein